MGRLWGDLGRLGLRGEGSKKRGHVHADDATFFELKLGHVVGAVAARPEEQHGQGRANAAPVPGRDHRSLQNGAVITMRVVGHSGEVSEALGQSLSVGQAGEFGPGTLVDMCDQQVWPPPLGDRDRFGWESSGRVGGARSGHRNRAVSMGHPRGGQPGRPPAPKDATRTLRTWSSRSLSATVLNAYEGGSGGDTASRRDTS